MQFSLTDVRDSSASPQDTLRKLSSTIGLGTNDEDGDDEGDLSRFGSQDLDEDDDDDEFDDRENDTSDETDDLSKPEKAEKKKKRIRMRRLRRTTLSRAYEFSGGNDVVGIIFLDISKITDLPPERNGKATWSDKCFLL